MLGAVYGVLRYHVKKGALVLVRTFPTENSRRDCPYLQTDCLQMLDNGVVDYGVLWRVEKSALTRRCLSTYLYYRE